MFPNGNVGLENSKFYEDVPARGHLIGRAATGSCPKSTLVMPAPAGTICVDESRRDDPQARRHGKISGLHRTGAGRRKVQARREAVAALKARSDLGVIKRSMFSQAAEETGGVGHSMTGAT